MTEALKKITFAEFSKNLARIFEHVIAEGESIVVDKGGGKLVTLTPSSPLLSRPKTEEDWAEFRAAAGSWDDVEPKSFSTEFTQTASHPVPL